MIRLAYLSVVCLAYAAAVDQVQETGTTPVPEDVARRELTNSGYVILYGDEVYRYPVAFDPVVRAVDRPQTRKDQVEENAIRTNEIDNGEEDKRPLFYFTTYEADDSRRPDVLPTSRPYIEIRKKRDVDGSEIPESSKVGKLRRKRTYCRKCGYGGGGRGGGYYAIPVPVSYSVYPVYHGGGGGGGRGCNTCGGGYGGGGGGGGSYSYSSSSAQSSSGSFGWGKK